MRRAVNDWVIQTRIGLNSDSYLPPSPAPDALVGFPRWQDATYDAIALTVAT